MKALFVILLFFSNFCFGNDYDNKCFQASEQIHIKLKKWAAETSDEYNLIVTCGDGLGTIIDGKFHTWWCPKFMIRGHRMTIEEIRPIAQNVSRSLWQLAKNNKEFGIFVFYSHKRYACHEPYLTPEHLGIRIDLWDENNDRYLYPYLSQVIFKDGKIHYYYADPDTQALQKPGIIEDFQP